MNYYDWAQIKIRSESGESAYAISKALGGRPTRQAIAKRAKKEGWGGRAATQSQRNATIPVAALNINSRKLTDELLTTLLHLIGKGSSENIACQAVGISQKAWIDWKNKDERLQDAVNRARAGKLSEWIERIDEAGKRDWKANQVLLQAAPETRNAFTRNGHSDNKLEVVINIDR